MNIRLVLPDPACREKSYPLAITQNEQGVYLIGDDWMLPLDALTVDEATEKNVRTVLQMPADVPLLLSQSLAFPDTYWLSEECLRWAEQWEATLVNDWKCSQRIAVEQQNEIQEIRKQFAGRKFSDSAMLLREDRDR